MTTPSTNADSAMPKSSTGKGAVSVWQRWLIRTAVAMAIVLAITLSLGLWLDLRGERAWAEMQQKLRAAGEPVTISDIDFPTVEDEDNYGAIPLLRDVAEPVLRDEDGEWDFYCASEVLRERLMTVSLKAESNYGDRLPRPLFASALLARRSDLKHWVRYLEKHAIFDLPKDVAKASGSAEQILQRLATRSDILDGLRVGLDRPDTLIATSLVETQLELGDDGYFWLRDDHIEPLIALVDALALRVSALTRLQEPTVAERVSAFESLRGMIQLTGLIGSGGGLHAFSTSNRQIRRVVDTLWECQQYFIFSAQQRETLQEDLKRIDVEKQLLRAVRIDLASTMDNFDYAAENFFFYDYPNLPHGLLRRLPGGVVDQNRATYAQLVLRFVLEPLKSDGLAGACKVARLDQFKAEFKRSRTFIPPDGIYVLLSGYGSFVRNAASAATLLEMARLACVLERHRWKNGTAAQISDYPQSLDGLTPGYLPELPSDPMTGDSLGYQRLDFGGYTLSSKGEDGKTSDDDWVWRIGR